MLKNLAKRLLPAAIRKRARRAHRRWILDRAIARLARADLTSDEIPATTLLKASYGWGNEGWSAGGDLLREILKALCETEGPILECGPGLSTLVLGVAAKALGREIWSLEHDPSWAERVRAELAQHSSHLAPAHVVCCGLKDYGEFTWYDPPVDELPGDFGLVLCDGPPADTPGGRFGLLPVLRDRLRPGCVIFLDDTGREAEQRILARWAADLGTEPKVLGATGAIGVIVTPAVTSTMSSSGANPQRR